MIEYFTKIENLEKEVLAAVDLWLEEPTRARLETIKVWATFLKESKADLQVSMEIP